MSAFVRSGKKTDWVKLTMNMDAKRCQGGGPVAEVSASSVMDDQQPSGRHGFEIRGGVMNQIANL